MAGHGAYIMRHQHTPLARRESEHIGVFHALGKRFLSALEVYRWLPSKDARDDIEVQIRIRLKPDPHLRDVPISALAASSLAFNPTGSGCLSRSSVHRRFWASKYSSSSAWCSR